MKKISRRVARKDYENGDTIYLLPSRIRLDNMWIQPYSINVSSGADFDRMVNNYKYYNCNSEAGLDVAFYIQ